MLFSYFPSAFRIRDLFLLKQIRIKYFARGTRSAEVLYAHLYLPASCPLLTDDFHIFVSMFPFPCQSALLFVTERCPCFSLVSQISSLCLKWNRACYSTTDLQLAKLSLNPLSRKCFSVEKQAEGSPTLSLSFGRRADADCNGVVMLMLVLTSWALSVHEESTTRVNCTVLVSVKKQKQRALY